MMNPNWIWRPLGELFEIGAGKTMSAAARAGANKVPFLRTANVLWDEIDLTEVDEMSIPPDELASKSLQAGDLLVCEGGEIGRAAVWDGRVPVMSFQNHLHRLRPVRDDVDARFYVYFLQSAFTQLGIFEGAGNKTTIPNLSRNRLADLQVPHPPVAEQRSIAGALAKVREAIGIHNRAMSTAQELKRAAMRELFTRGLRGEPQKETEIGLVPESWNVERLDSRSQVVSTRMSYTELEGANNAQANAVRVVGIKVSDMNRIGNETVIAATALEKLLDADVVAYRCAPPGTIVFPKRGAAIATNKKRLTETWSVFDPNVIGVVPSDIINVRFLFHWFQSFDLRTLTEPGPTPQLNKKHLDPLPIPVPPTIEEQKEIAVILDAIDRKIDLHRQKRAVLEELFKALLHKLMTGEIRVADLDLSALEPPHEPQVAA
jgi:type I restriction enzyme S subunit